MRLILNYCLLFVFAVGLFACNSTPKVEEGAEQGEQGKTVQTEKTTPPTDVSKEFIALKIGQAAPMTEAKMKNIDGKELSLEDVKGENGTLVMFSCNTCPYVLRWEDRYAEVAKMCQEQKIGLITINSNEKQRGKQDSFEAMQTHAKEKNYNFAYVLDKNSALADAFGATKTPDVFLFDKEMNLKYKGAIDDNAKNAKDVKEPYLKNAIKNMVEGKEVKPAETKSIGCSIKRMKKV